MSNEVIAQQIHQKYLIKFIICRKTSLNDKLHKNFNNYIFKYIAKKPARILGVEPGLV